jgi:hypothetical protein
LDLLNQRKAERTPSYTSQRSRIVLLLWRAKKHIDYMTPKISPYYLVSELAYAVLRKIMKLCKEKCGKIPRSDVDCVGFQVGDYSCVIRRVSDDATFHAEMKWSSVLGQDL